MLLGAKICIIPITHPLNLKIAFHLVGPVFLEDSIKDIKDRLFFLKEELLRAEDDIFISVASTASGLLLLPAPTSLYQVLKPNQMCRKEVKKPSPNWPGDSSLLSLQGQPQASWKEFAFNVLQMGNFLNKKKIILKLFYELIKSSLGISLIRDF